MTRPFRYAAEVASEAAMLDEPLSAKDRSGGKLGPRLCVLELRARIVALDAGKYWKKHGELNRDRAAENSVSSLRISTAVSLRF